MRESSKMPKKTQAELKTQNDDCFDQMAQQDRESQAITNQIQASVMSLKWEPKDKKQNYNLDWFCAHIEEMFLRPALSSRKKRRLPRMPQRRPRCPRPRRLRT